LRRGDLYLATLEPAIGSEQRGTRPIVIVSRDVLNESTPRVIGIPFSTYRRQPLVAHRALVHARPGGLLVDSLGLCEQVRVFDKVRLLRQLGALNGEEMSRIEAALERALGLDTAPTPPKR
jgi:mRNA interferase MazF